MPLFLSQSFGQTALDLENPGPYGSLNILDTITQYPATNTGTPTNTANPGSPLNFYQSFLPTSTYLEDMRNDGSKFLRLGNVEIGYNIFDATNLDTERPGVGGGIPYKKLKDPTVYPITAKKETPIRGKFATAGKPAEKYNQSFSPTFTYSEFIKPFI